MRPMMRVASLIILIGFVTGCATLPKKSSVSNINWTDYREPLAKEMRIFQFQQHQIHDAVINVKLPEDFLNKHKQIILVVDAESKTNDGFKLLRPYFAVNDSIFKTASIKMEDLPYRQTVEVAIDRDLLKPGQNVLQASFRWNGNYYCRGFGCGYVIHKIYFKNAPTLT